MTWGAFQKGADDHILNLKLIIRGCCTIDIPKQIHLLEIFMVFGTVGRALVRLCVSMAHSTAYDGLTEPRHHFSFLHSLSIVREVGGISGKPRMVHSHPEELSQASHIQDTHISMLT
jgi:hypothetical protein